MKKVDVLTFSDVLPRVIKRIDLLTLKYKIQVFTYERLYFNINKIKSTHKIISLGKVTDGKLLFRLLNIFSTISLIKSNKKSDNCYCFGYDMAFYALLCRYKKIHLEIGDLRITPESRLLKKIIFGTLEKIILKRIKLLVVVTPKMVTYFKNINPNLNVCLIANKCSKNQSYKRNKNSCEISENKPIRIGYIGSIRFRTIFNIVKYVSSNQRDFTLDIFGDGRLATELKNDIKDINNIRFHGPFKNPDDLETIYNKIDVNYIVYDKNAYNVRLALPNKLYESIMYNTPIIASEGTALCEEVSKYKIGICLDVQNISSEIKKIDHKSLRVFRNNLLKIPENYYIHNDDDILDKIKF